ncbi:MAG TPA: 1-acyl-sn-glycerol-3-phosphate acyltransferase [Nitrospirae bacterium]|nr:1-acyl-sn-glycerol-3-phosphate acyltransferase [bacterium BMS3Abin09]GBE40950.1 1-acyl-sn-glycerol-3-phosphate acyltransferase [bacterium BMS3Bbin09]HDN95285.1 1-acyl-sn-glycerol-3-phosphate acyltransferase [Nitrospirota bacterium]HDO67291.1 1-acyl-sn-glycerol-3-phosphate acyltransferase [Nitrospirota bacterium]HDZ84557.1 1-acyl-sn-glycerol-3-phosphate acyltransferase [Nitrospirota bacterium]
MELIADIIYKLIAITIRTIFFFNGGLEVVGKENIPKEGVIIASNHISYLDPPIIGSVTPRRCNFMAKKGLFDVPVLGWLIKFAAFPVDRETPRPSTIKEAVKRIRNGHIVVVFPEGQRNETDELLEPKPGIGMVAVMSRAPIVPAYISGADKALPPNARWLKRAKIKVVFGKPIYYTSTEESRGRTGQGKREEVSMMIMDAIRELKAVGFAGK